MAISILKSHNSYDLIPPMRETWQNWIGLTYDNYFASRTKTCPKVLEKGFWNYKVHQGHSASQNSSLDRNFCIK